MVITDLPGVGESRDRDAEYEALYRDILPELDLVCLLYTSLLISNYSLSQYRER